MKRIHILLIVSLVFLFSCSEEPIGQYPVDEEAPQPVTGVSVENFNGYSEITYQIPNDKDLLYVGAIYKNSHGEEKEVRASAFSNTLVVEGFGLGGDFNVELVAVDKSDNKSTAVPVTISPGDSPIYSIFESIKMLATFGGVKLSWDNPTKTGIIVSVLVRNDEGLMVEADKIYGSAEIGNGAVRGLPAEETRFGVIIEDTYKNTTDTLIANLTPLFEEKLDKTLHREMSFSKRFTQSNYGGSQYLVWDGDEYNVNGTAAFDLYGNGVDSIYWNYDLGVTAKLSRFKMWARGSHFYQLAHPRHFQIWGTTDPVIANDTESFDGWELLFEVKTEKVSGNDEYGEITAEDLAYARAGEEFEMGLPAPEARFIRFRTLETWGHMDRSWITELSWWGEIIEVHN